MSSKIPLLFLFFFFSFAGCIETKEMPSLSLEWQLKITENSTELVKDKSIIWSIKEKTKNAFLSSEGNSAIVTRKGDLIYATPEKRAYLLQKKNLTGAIILRDTIFSWNENRVYELHPNGTLKKIYQIERILKAYPSLDKSYVVVTSEDKVYIIKEDKVSSYPIVRQKKSEYFAPYREDVYFSPDSSCFALLRSKREMLTEEFFSPAENNNLYVFSEGLEVLWKKNITGYISSVSPANECTVVGVSTLNLQTDYTIELPFYVFDSNGNLKWSYNGTNGFSSVAVSPNKEYVAAVSSDGEYYLFKDGRLKEKGKGLNERIIFLDDRTLFSYSLFGPNVVYVLNLKGELLVDAILNHTGVSGMLIYEKDKNSIILNSFDDNYWASVIMLKSNRKR